MEICALTDTLVIDEEGVYDPGLYNDRLLLGFKGTMSEAELHWLHQRLQGGKLTKAEQGHLRFRLPSGLVYDPVGQVVREWTRPNGLRIGRRRIPLGVIAIIYESRPNVTTDAAALCEHAISSSSGIGRADGRLVTHAEPATSTSIQHRLNVE